MSHERHTRPRKMLVMAVLGVVACGEKIRSDERPQTTQPAGVSAPSRDSYVGLRRGSLPAGVTSEGGAVIPSRGSSGGGPYAFTRVRTPRGEMVWLDSISAGGAPSPARIVRAELRLPPLARDERVMLASCDVDGALDGRVVAIVVNQPNVTKFTQVRQAWRANPATGAFEVIPVTGITCEEP